MTLTAAILTLAFQPPAPAVDIDATTLVGKVMCGYQGWFRTPNDGEGQGWFHWSRESRAIRPDTLTVEMWPDVTEYPASALTQADAFTIPLKKANPVSKGKGNSSDKPAMLFTSAHPGVVDLHFRWMREYGIDGVFVQRFVSGISTPEASIKEAKVLTYARDAARRHGRTFTVEYDMSGVPAAQALAHMRRDWAYLTQVLKIDQDPRYLHHNGRPVLAIFGFFSDRFSGADANLIIDAFKPKVSLIGAGQWWWRAEKDADWQRAFRRFTAYSPWDVGNVTVENGVKKAPFGRWAADLAEAKRAGVLLLPTLYPGFSWDNLTRKAPGTTLISRRRGEFLREQFSAMQSLGIGQGFVAMFDEVDEATAVFNVTDQFPSQGHFVGLDGLPSDAYLRIVGEGSRAVRRAGR